MRNRRNQVSRRVRQVITGAGLAAALLVGTAVQAGATPAVSWTDQFGGVGTDAGTGVAVARNGDVIVYGISANSLAPGHVVSGASDAFLAAYNKAGDRKWIVQFGAAGTEYTSRAVAVAANGDIVVAGMTLGAAFPGFTLNGTADVFVARFNRRGQQLWLKQFGSSNVDLVWGLTLSSGGDIFLAITTGAAFPSGGSTVTSFAGEADAVVTKLDRKGNIKWSRAIGSAVGDFGAGVAVNRRGDVYLAGATAGEIDPVAGWGGGDDAFIAKFDRNGVQQWVRQSGLAEDDRFWSVAVTPQGDAVAAGVTSKDNFGTIPGYKTLHGPADGMVVKFSSVGVPQWSNQHGGDGGDVDYSVAVTRGGQIVVGGLTDGAWSGYANAGSVDVYVARLTPDGTTVTARQAGTAGEDGNTQFGVGIALSGSTRVVMTSSTEGRVWGHEQAGMVDAFVAVFPTP